MKYRCLTNEELKELEEEFKHFLITNNIYTEEWEQLNKEQNERVQLLVEMFSDVVLDKALKNIRFLECLTVNDIKYFKCDTDKMVLIGITAKNKNIDFTKDTLSDFAAELTIFKTQKGYQLSRELEIFNLVESGCSIINEERFKKIELAHTYSLQQNKN